MALIRFTCVQTCYWNTVYEVGQSINVVRAEDIPPEIRKCWQERTLPEEVEERQAVANMEASAILSLQKELDDMGVAYDRRWGRTQLEGTVALAKKDAEPTPAPEKSLERMNKDELQEVATDLGLEFEEENTKAELRDMIEEARSSDG